MAGLVDMIIEASRRPFAGKGSEVVKEIKALKPLLAPLLGYAEQVAVVAEKEKTAKLQADLEDMVVQLAILVGTSHTKMDLVVSLSELKFTKLEEEIKNLQKVRMEQNIALYELLAHAASGQSNAGQMARKEMDARIRGASLVTKNTDDSLRSVQTEKSRIENMVWKVGSWERVAKNKDVTREGVKEKVMEAWEKLEKVAVRQEESGAGSSSAANSNSGANS